MKFNSKLEEEFNLLPVSELDEEVVDDIDEVNDLVIIPTNDIQSIDKIDHALPIVSGMDEVERDLQDIAKMAIESHKTLMELATNVEDKYIAELASSASAMLGHAVTAKTNIIKQKLDLINLQIKKLQIDNKKMPSSNDPNEVVGKGHVLNRNELLAKLLQKPDSEK